MSTSTWWVVWLTVVLGGVVAILMYEQKVQWKEYIHRIQPVDLETYDRSLTGVWLTTAFFLGGALIVIVMYFKTKKAIIIKQ